MRKRTNKLVIPFLKWVGGKRQLLEDIDTLFPNTFSNYCEPFVGGGAVLFHVQPKYAIINDNNTELINVYQVIKNYPEQLIKDLKKHHNEKEYFYSIRELDRNENIFNSLNPIERASRIIFLNKTCYNGLFRVNQAGEFNTPFGNYKNPKIVNDITIRAVSNYLNKNNVIIKNTDYEDVILKVKKNTFVYIDPPYDPVSESSSFTGYTKGGFDKQEQKRLKENCDKLNAKNIKFLLSNSSTNFIQDLYKDYNISIVKAKRAINSRATARGDVNEVLVRNYE